MPDFLSTKRDDITILVRIGLLVEIDGYEDAPLPLQGVDIMLTFCGL
jgi:hypothetical protein